jgi:hypothetical protein
MLYASMHAVYIYLLSLVGESSIDLCKERGWCIAGGFNWQRAIRTLLVDKNLSVLLPLTEFLPFQKQVVDPFAAIGGQRKVYRMLREAFSPLHLAAIGIVPRASWLTLIPNRCIVSYMHLRQSNPLQ